MECGEAQSLTQKESDRDAHTAIGRHYEALGQNQELLLFQNLVNSGVTAVFCTPDSSLKFTDFSLQFYAQ